MRCLIWLEKKIALLCRLALFTFIAIIVISGFLQVFCRFILKFSLKWTDEMCRFAMVWLTLIGAGYAVKMNSHIAVDLLKEVVPAFVVKVLNGLAGVFSLIVSVVLIYFGFRLSSITMKQIAPGLGIPMGIVYFALPLGGALMFFYSMFLFISSFVSERR